LKDVLKLERLILILPSEKLEIEISAEMMMKKLGLIWLSLTMNLQNVHDLVFLEVAFCLRSRKGCLGKREEVIFAPSFLNLNKHGPLFPDLPTCQLSDID